MERAHCSMMSSCRMGQLRYLSRTMHHIHQAAAVPALQSRRHSPCAAAEGSKRGEAASDNRRSAGSKAISNVLDGMSSDARRRKLFTLQQNQLSNSDRRKSDSRGTSDEQDISRQPQLPPLESRSRASRSRHPEGDQGRDVSSKRDFHKKTVGDKAAIAGREGSRTKHSEHTPRGDPPPSPFHRI